MSNFIENFKFYRKFQILSKISNFIEIFKFYRNFQILLKFSIYSEIFYFLRKKFQVDDLIRSGFDWQNYWDGTRSMERILEPVRKHLLVKTGNFLKILRNFKGENERTFESYIHAVTSFYLGQTGDILSDISHMIADGVNGKILFFVFENLKFLLLSLNFSVNTFFELFFYLNPELFYLNPELICELFYLNPELFYSNPELFFVNFFI